MINRYARLATRMFNTPLAIYEPKAEIIMGALTDRLGISTIVNLHGDVVVPGKRAFYDEIDDGESDEGGDSFETYGYDVELGVARIEIDGTLVQRTGCLRPESGMTGYNGIRQNFVEAMNDPAVRAIMFEIDSPGGEVAGMFALADLIYEGRGRGKPIWAVLNECAFSAAYCLASACDYITVPRTGGVGSIGIVWMHVDMSQRLTTEGIRVTFVKRGANKVDGAPELPLSSDVLARFQRDIDTVGVMFEELVGKHRGLSAAKIRDMNALTFLGAEGVTALLADAVMDPDEAFRALLTKLG